MSKKDEPTESEVERLWLEEAERRIKEFRKGKVRAIPADKVLNRQGWDETFTTMGKNGDDELVIGDNEISHSWDEEEWQW